MTRHLFLRATLALFLSLGAGSLSLAPACGNELEQPDRTISLSEVKGGRLLFKTNQPGRFLPAPTLKTDVRISVTGLIARATVSQEFLNPSLDPDAWAEGIYVFPLPETAAVDHLRMKIGERIIEGQIKEKADAKKVYEQAKQEAIRYLSTEYHQPFDHLVEKYCTLGPVSECIATIEQYIEAGVEHLNLIPICSPSGVMDQLQQISAGLFSRFRTSVSES